MSLQPKPLKEGYYIIEPKDTSTETLLIGPVPIDAPDVPVKVNNHPLIEHWLVKAIPGGKYAVYSKRDRDSDYKWIAKEYELYASSHSKTPGEFRIESVGDGYYRIVYGGNNAVTFVKESGPDHPQLIFTPWKGDEVQKFKFTYVGETSVE